MSSELRITEENVRETRLFITIGYILRVFPLISIGGFLLTLFGWLKLFLRVRNKLYALAFIGSLVLLVATLYSTYVSMFKTIELVPSIPTERLTFNEVKEILRNTTLFTKSEMENPSIYLTEVIIAVGIVLEALGVRQLHRDTRRFIPLYLTVLFIVLAILHLIVSILHPLTAPRLLDVLESIDKAESMLDIQSVYMELLVVILPLTAVGALNFIITIVTYILMAYKYWKLYGELVKLRIITGGESAIATI